MKAKRYVRKDRRDIARDLAFFAEKDRRESNVNLYLASMTAYHHDEFEFFTWAVRWLTRNH